MRTPRDAKNPETLDNLGANPSGRLVRILFLETAPGYVANAPGRSFFEIL